ncbi:isochorismatase family protein [Acidobacteria bacterium ACD]|nr:MAG: isochorismatase family protein [Acidobacteriota bacterium]MCE7957148.1 isochorismatase family protein [Acidobacteria bacterium ACB2]MDL1948867.1 isochorismatase family protein [Acidobacteria bacterium ACD]
MELLDVRRSVLVVVDLQGKLTEMVHQPRAVLEVAQRLLRMAGLFGVPAVLTEQYPKGLGPTHPAVRAAFDALTGPKAFVEKTSFGCCGDPGFERAVAEVLPGVAPERRQVVVAGIEAHVCVMQTVLELRRAGNGVFVCWDGVSSRGEEYRRRALDRMTAAGAVLTNHESVAFEWMRDKNDPRFKAVSALLKEGQPAG